MSIEILIKTPGLVVPELQPGQFRYLLAQDGVYLERRTSMFTSSVKVDGLIPLLEPHRSQCRLDCGQIPAALLQRMVGFFQAAYELHGGEAALVLLYFPHAGEFAWHCPKQTIRTYSWWGKIYADDSVRYDNPLELPPGAVHFGDAHSHVGPPNPSIVDQNDEAHLDGLHLIVGNVASQRPSWHADFSIDGHRFSVPLEMVLEAIPEAPFPEPPAEWMQQIHVIQPSSSSRSSSKWNTSGTYTVSTSPSTSPPRYSSTLKNGSEKSSDDDDEKPHRGETDSSEEDNP